MPVPRGGSDRGGPRSDPGPYPFVAGTIGIKCELSSFFAFGVAHAQNRWTPGIVPYGADQTVYLVIDRFRGGSVYRETSQEIAREIQTRCDIQGDPIPDHLQEFVDSYAGPNRQLALRLV